ncbi:MAG: Aspartyl/glutamyl-tRNA(Asn/Gln) amidotransferase subunit B [Parcubacteria group bacterium GW2011_GWB1_43_8]|nr:MAG: Aspartyl/glutamyl-tRNA(Asn/Gln) amidotransferase subunit B [Parcubacteria group bacterium GW2011_GWB1_43_8]
MEEDTGRLIHAKDETSSLVDFNRAGVPLMELVTEPCINSGEQARKFAEELQLVLRYLEISDADMEKGQMRAEVNISIAERNNGLAKQNLSRFTLPRSGAGSDASQDFASPRLNAVVAKLGTKVEIKNLNSFRSVERAVEYEIKRQTAVLEAGGKVIHETRGWDENNQKTFSQREKEMAHDYRYFPEPDLPPLKISELDFDLSLPELPEEKRKRFKEKYGLKDEAVEIFIQDISAGKFFESVISHLADKPKETVSLASNYSTSDLAGLLKESGKTFSDLKINPEMFAKLVAMAGKGEISSRGAKNVLKIMFEEGGDPEKIVEEKGLKQDSDDGFIKGIIEEVVKNNTSAVEEYKNGKENALQFLVGQGMKLSKGKANPAVLQKLLKEKFGK